MKKNLTEIVFILDQSGSMAGLEGDTIGGFNSMIDKQKHEEGRALVTTILFSTASRMLHDRVDVRKVDLMTRKDYVPGGGTALLDAVGDAIRHISMVHRYAREEDRPEKTLFVITTDGQENASRRFSADEVKTLIRQQKKLHGWEFLFLGANIDAVETASGLGIGAEYAANYHADDLGMTASFNAVGNAISQMRACSSVAPDWKDGVQRDYASRSSRR